MQQQLSADPFPWTALSLLVYQLRTTYDAPLSVTPRYLAAPRTRAAP